MRHARIWSVPVAALAVALGCGPSTKPAKPATKPPAKDPWQIAVAAQVKPYITNEIVTGVMIGVIDGEREWTYGFGSSGNGNAAPNAKTLFELGAATKVYTGVLLADAIERKEVALATEISTLMPLGVTVPTAGGTAITVEQLITQRSGLPPIPGGIAAVPPAKYTEELLFADLGRTKLLYPPGKGFLFSNFALAVLGVGLARATKSPSWEAALEARVLAPLGLKSTVVAVPAGQAGRHAVGHSDDGRVVPFSSFGALAPAAALRSTVADQLAFLRANIDAAGGKQGAIYAALRRSHQVITEAGGEQVAMGWFVDSAGRRYTNGVTDGFHVFLEVDLDRRQAVVVLASTATSLVDHMGDAIMDLLAKERPNRIKFPSTEQMMALIGTYQVTGTKIGLAIHLDGKKLLIKLPDGSRARLMPVGGTRFFLERDQALATFEGETLTIRSASQALQATRVRADGAAGAGAGAGSGSGSGSAGGAGSGSAR